MSIVSRNRPPFGEEGYAIVYAGEAVTVGFRLQQPDGAGGYEVQSYTGREFALRVYSDGGATDVNVNGEETSHADGAYIACVLTSSNTTSLTTGFRGWEFVEYTANGRVVICAGQFEIALGASAAQSDGSPGSGSTGITLYTLRTDTNIVTVNYMGATGAAPWATPAAWVTATAYTATAPRSVVTNGGSSYVCLVSHTAGTFATDLAAAKWLLIASGGGGGAGAWGDITGTLSAQTDLQSALDAKQASDGDLTTFAGLSPSNDDLLQRKAGAWANRTPAQVKTDLALVKGDVGLGNVDNTSDASKPVSTATQTALDGKQTANANLTTFAGLTPGADDFLQYKGSAWAARTPAQAKTDLALVKGDVGLGNVDNTADTAKPVSTAQQTALDLKAPIASPTFTGTVAGITKSMVGLGNVDNTSDLNKPISTATQTALDLKQNADADLTAIGALTSAADKVPYATGAGAWALADFTAAGRTIAGAADAGAQRTALSLVPGTDVQAYSANLGAVAGVTSAADKLFHFTGSGTGAVTDFTSTGRTLVGGANAAAMRTTLELVIGTDVQAYDADLAAIAALTPATRQVVQYVGSAWTAQFPTESLIVAVGDEVTAITTGTAKVTFRMPYAFKLTAVRASLTTASSSGAPAFDVNRNGTSIFSTTLTIDQSEKTSTTAATAAALSTTDLSDDDEITIDIDTAGTGAAGPKLYFIGYRTA